MSQYFSIAYLKDEIYLGYIFQLNCLHTEKRKIILGNCNTKWSARDEEYEHLYLALSYIAGSLKIINGALPEIRDLDKTPTDGWNPKAKIEITSYFKALKEFCLLLVNYFIFTSSSKGTYYWYTSRKISRYRESM